MHFQFRKNDIKIQIIRPDGRIEEIDADELDSSEDNSSDDTDDHGDEDNDFNTL
jgi:hypothetical protein